MAIQLVLEFRKSQVCLLASSFAFEGRSPRTGTASIKTFFSAQVPADRNVTSMPTVWAATGVQCVLLNMGSPQGRPGSMRKETEVSRSSPESSHTLRGTQHKVAKCSICFKILKTLLNSSFTFQDTDEQTTTRY